MNEIKTALKRLEEQNQREFDGSVMEQVIFPPDEPVLTTIPTLDRGCRKPMTEMLRARFEFGGKWVNAMFGQTWLSLSEMETLWQNPAILAALECDREYYDGPVLQATPWERLSLFGIDLEDGSKTFLDWSDETEAEPGIVIYASYSVFRYPNFRASIEALSE